jgi:hypothetical protein
VIRVTIAHRDIFVMVVRKFIHAALAIINHTTDTLTVSFVPLELTSHALAKLAVSPAQVARFNHLRGKDPV